MLLSVVLFVITEDFSSGHNIVTYQVLSIIFQDDFIPFGLAKVSFKMAFLINNAEYGGYSVYSRAAISTTVSNHYIRT